MNATEQILTKILKCRRVDLYTKEREMKDFERAVATQMLERFESGEPLQYILGEIAFCDLSLKVNRNVLIPRFETEILVDRIIFTLQGLSDLTFLDLGTGSGNIAISLAKAFPNSRVFAVDISPEAVGLAKENAAGNGVEKQITFICEDMHTFLEEQAGKIAPFDCVVSNPPYISTKEIACLPPDVRQEPVLALDGGEDGCRYYRLIAPHLTSWLKMGGYCFLEIGETQKEKVAHIFEQHPESWQTNIWPDYTGADRIFQAQWIRKHG